MEKIELNTDEDFILTLKQELELRYNRFHHIQDMDEQEIYFESFIKPLEETIDYEEHNLSKRR